MHHAITSRWSVLTSRRFPSLAIKPAQLGQCAPPSEVAPRLTLLFLSLCVLAAIRPIITPSPSTITFSSSAGFPGWNTAPTPAGLAPLALSPREAKFTQRFPGQIAAFTDGRSTWLVRWLSHPTRKLHPATDCLRATGYTVVPEPIFAAHDGTHWGTLTATRGSEKLIVRERIIDAEGHEFTDVSAWFWSAALEKSSGPWWCLTRIENLQ